jgi:hypothetical protein
MATSTETRLRDAGATVGGARDAVGRGTSALAQPGFVRLWCGIAAVLVALLAVGAYLVANDGRLSVLVHMSPGEPMARVARSDADFVFVDPAAHYDGVYFYAIALDPLAVGQPHTLIDQAAGRYGHPAYAWAAAIVSLGQQRLLPWALLAVGLVSLFVAGLATSDLAVLLGWTPWLGLAVALNPGLIYAVSADTSETFGAALLMVTLLAWLSGRRRIAAILLVPLCFAKEPLLAVPAGLAIWEVVEWLRHRMPAGELRRRLLLLVPGPLLYLGWLIWVRAQFGLFPFQEGTDRIGLPLASWADTLSRAATLALGNFGQMQVGQAGVALLAVVFAGVVIGILAGLRFRTPIDPIFLLTGLLTLTLGWVTLLYPKDMIRIMSFAFLLWPFVLLGRRQPGATTATPAAAESAGDLPEREVRDERQD